MANKKKPELLIPAGDTEKLKTACEYGADAVYIGGLQYSLRAKSGNFDYDAMRGGIEYAHAKGVKVYAAVNVFAHNSDLRGMTQYLSAVKQMNADALIISDPGVFSVAKETVPDMDIHISTQANVTNYKSVMFWKNMGAKRVVLARELSFKEITQIREAAQGGIELEAFVHGAMCVSYSGRCLLSAYLSGRDSNSGFCSHPCRWEYAVSQHEQSKRGEYFPIEEDERGTYILSSKDLCMIRHIPELARCGLDSFKIEGRMKSPYYVAAITKVYREAIDDYFECEEKYFSSLDYYLAETQKCGSRDFTTGFYFGKPSGDAQISGGCSNEGSHDFIGAVKSYDPETRLAVIEQRNKFSKGDSAEFLSPGHKNRVMVINEMYDEDMLSVNSAPHPQQLLFVKTDFPVKPLDIIRRV